MVNRAIAIKRMVFDELDIILLKTSLPRLMYVRILLTSKCFKLIIYVT